MLWVMERKRDFGIRIEYKVIQSSNSNIPSRIVMKGFIALLRI